MDSNSALKSFFFFLAFTFLCLNQVRASKSFNIVEQYGAVADGKTDCSKAFENAWKDACQYSGKRSIFLIPSGTFLLRPIVLKGPCKSPIEFQIKGNLNAPTDKASHFVDHWITFRYIANFTISDSGVLNGQGPSAWPYKDCKKDPNCPALPPTIRFNFINNSWVNDITSVNSKNVHFDIFACNYMYIRNIKLSTPAESPNTDGIRIGKSSNIHILDSKLGTGDDCVGLLGGSQHINITNVQCGPGHGISIGSLGQREGEVDVFDITVKNVNFTKTDNGIRIKTWAHSYRSQVYDLNFEDINFIDVKNPIIIDQQYCPSGKCDQSESSGIKIKNVKINNVRGTSKTKVAVALQCSKRAPCEVELRNINIEYKGKDGPAISTCSNVRGAAYGKQQPPSCI